MYVKSAHTRWTLEMNRIDRLIDRFIPTFSEFIYLLLSWRREHLHARALQIRAELSTHIHRETVPQRPTHNFWSSFWENKTRARQKATGFSPAPGPQRRSPCRPQQASPQRRRAQSPNKGIIYLLCSEVRTWLGVRCVVKTRTSVIYLYIYVRFPLYCLYLYLSIYLSIYICI